MAIIGNIPYFQTNPHTTLVDFKKSPHRGCPGSPGRMGVPTGRISEEEPGSSTAHRLLRTGSASPGGTDWRRPASRTDSPCLPRRVDVTLEKDKLPTLGPDTTHIEKRDLIQQKQDKASIGNEVRNEHAAQQSPLDSSKDLPTSVLTG